MMEEGYTKRERALYRYAVHCALEVLVRQTLSRGSGWYHFVENELVVASEVVL